MADPDHPCAACPSLSLLIPGDFRRIFLNLEPIFVHPHPGTTLQRFGVPLAKRRWIQYTSGDGSPRAFQAFGDNREQSARLLESDVTWYVKTSDYRVGTPRIGHQIIDRSGEIWTVAEYHNTNFGQRWRLLCRSVRPTGNPLGKACTVNIQKADYQQSPTGDYQAEWRDWWTALPGLLTIGEETSQTEFGQQLGNTTGTLVVDADISIAITELPKYRASLDDGTVWTITTIDWQRSVAAHRLTHMTVERTQWPEG